MSPLTNYLVIDLEATCCDLKTIPRHEMEIIEIGAVMVDGETLSAIDEFQIFIKPVRHPVLTPFCTQLTTITQNQVDQGVSYPEAIAKMQDWLSPYENYIFGSWGEYDRKQFQQDSKFHHIPFPFNCPHRNLKQLFSDNQGLSRKYGMAQALELAQIPLEGTHHRGLDDAKNIAKLLPFILGYQKISNSLSLK